MPQVERAERRKTKDLQGFGIQVFFGGLRPDPQSSCCNTRSLPALRIQLSLRAECLPTNRVKFVGIRMLVPTEADYQRLVSLVTHVV